MDYPEKPCYQCDKSLKKIEGFSCEELCNKWYEWLSDLHKHYVEKGIINDNKM